ncbi:MAG: hypothetical protein IJ449_05700 [Clostridia bacterium]|nr:hypothetical protein [Clostridia bacterium]
MKHLLHLLLTAAILCTLASCGGETAQTGSDTTSSAPAVTDQNDTATAADTIAETTADTVTETPTETPTAAATYTCTFDNGISITVGGNAADALAALGEYTDMMEAPSCVHEGYDRVYTYGSYYKVTTSPDAAGNEYVAQVEMLSDLAALEIGGTYLMIGSSEEEVRTALGDPAEDTFGVQKYPLEGADMTVIIDGGAVTGMTVAVAVQE